MTGQVAAVEVAQLVQAKRVKCRRQRLAVSGRLLIRQLRCEFARKAAWAECAAKRSIGTRFATIWLPASYLPSWGRQLIASERGISNLVALPPVRPRGVFHLPRGAITSDFRWEGLSRGSTPRRGQERCGAGKREQEERIRTREQKAWQSGW